MEAEGRTCINLTEWAYKKEEKQQQKIPDRKPTADTWFLFPSVTVSTQYSTTTVIEIHLQYLFSMTIQFLLNFKVKL